MSDEPPPPVDETLSGGSDENIAKTDIDLGVSTENVDLMDEQAVTSKSATMPLNDDLFFSTMTDPVELEDSAEAEVNRFNFLANPFFFTEKFYAKFDLI